jgi:CheY-like chemotaxis protein
MVGVVHHAECHIMMQAPQSPLDEEGAVYANAEKPVPVLVVEDDVPTRQVVRWMLEDEGYTVYEAPDGISALERLRSSPQPLVVLLDWWMPGIDGLQVLRALARDADVVRRHAYVLLTAVPDSARLRAVDMPPGVPVAVLGKPFDLDKLFATVDRAAAGLRLGD